MRAKDSYDVLAKMIIIGDSGVGKTNLILSFINEPFKDNYVATIGVDFKAKSINVDDKRVKLQIWDTAGQQRYRTITQTYYKGASAIILAYSINDRSTFDSLNKWIVQISEKTPPGVPKIILANKSDLPEEDRAVSAAEGQKMAEQYSTENCKILFMEVSAKTGEGVNDAFYLISKQVKQDFERVNIVRPVIKIAKMCEPDAPASRCAC